MKDFTMKPPRQTDYVKQGRRRSSSSTTTFQVSPFSSSQRNYTNHNIITDGAGRGGGGGGGRRNSYTHRIPWATTTTTITFPFDKAVAGHPSEISLDPNISLLTPEEVKDQGVWDEEFTRRQRDLERQQLQSRERRQRVSAKMEELRGRWEGVERRRDIRSRQTNRQSLESRETTMIHNAPAPDSEVTPSTSGSTVS